MSEIRRREDTLKKEMQICNKRITSKSIALIERRSLLQPSSVARPQTSTHPIKAEFKFNDKAIRDGRFCADSRDKGLSPPYKIRQTVQ